MVEDVEAEIRNLRTLPASALRKRYAELFGEPSRSGNRQWLFRRIAWRLQSQAEGGLSERASKQAEELARDADVRIRPPKGFTVEAAPSSLRTVSGRLVAKRDDRLPAPGTVLTRVFKGIEYRTTVLSIGFEYDGRVYKSLSGVAQAISGSHWNGYHFFGLIKPERSKS